jgi:hypothetical protein
VPRGNVPGTVRPYRAIMREVRPAGGQALVPGRVTARRSRLLVALLAVLVILTVMLAAASVPLYAATRQNWVVNGSENVLVAVVFGVVGVIIVRRHPGNPIGWMLEPAHVTVWISPRR